MLSATNNNLNFLQTSHKSQFTFSDSILNEFLNINPSQRENSKSEFEAENNNGSILF